MAKKQVDEIWNDLIQEAEVLSKLGVSKRTLRRYRTDALLIFGKDYFSAMGKNYIYSQESILRLIKVNIK